MPLARIAKENNRGSASEANATGEDVLEHHPVPRERVERMLERRRPVLLEEEVPHPGEAVAAHQRAKQPPGIAGHDRHRHQQIGEHTSELQSLMRISYAVFCLKKKTLRDS